MDRTDRRLDRLRRTLKKDRAEAYLIVSERNVRYLTGFTGDSSALFVTRDLALMASDGRYTTQPAQECPGLECHIRPVGQLPIKAIVEVAGKVGAGRLAFE